MADSTADTFKLDAPSNDFHQMLNDTNHEARGDLLGKIYTMNIIIEDKDGLIIGDNMTHIEFLSDGSQDKERKNDECYSYEDKTFPCPWGYNPPTTWNIKCSNPKLGIEYIFNYGYSSTLIDELSSEHFGTKGPKFIGIVFKGCHLITDGGKKTSVYIVCSSKKFVY